MAYAELNLDQGTSFETAMDLAGDDGAPIDITNYVFQCQIRKSYYSNSAAATLTTNITDAAAGKIKLSLDSAATANIKAGRYLYDVKMTTDQGVTTRVVEGIITVTPQVSR